MADIIKYPTGKAYVDLTGQYLTMSSSGNQYILVVYDYDLNAIIGEPLKIHHKVDIVNGYRNLQKQLISNGSCLVLRSGHRGYKAYSLWDGVVPKPEHRL